jgi:hypothetical protein
MLPSGHFKTSLELKGPLSVLMQQSYEYYPVQLQEYIDDPEMTFQIVCKLR